MNIVVSAQHTELTETLEAAVKEKFNRIQQHADIPLTAHVVLRIDSGQHKVDATVNGANCHLVANTTGKDMYNAINSAAKIIDRQWRKHKTAKIDKKRETIRRHASAGV